MKTRTKALITVLVLISLGSLSYGYLTIENAPLQNVTVYVTVDFNHQNYSGYGKILVWVNATWNGNVAFKTYYGTCGGVRMSLMGRTYNNSMKNLTYDRDNRIVPSTTFTIRMTISNTQNRVSNCTPISTLKHVYSNKTIPGGYYAVVTVAGGVNNPKGLCHVSDSFGGFNTTSNYPLIYIPEEN